VDWEAAGRHPELVRFVQRMIRMRREHPVFRRRRYFQGRPIRGGVKDILWLNPEGQEMTDNEWSQAFARSMAVYLAGDSLLETDRRGKPMRDDNFLLLLNAHHDTIEFMLPQIHPGSAWQVLVDTSFARGLTIDGKFSSGVRYGLQGRSLALLIELTPEQ
jgi:glycogen operon protein